MEYIAPIISAIAAIIAGWFAYNQKTKDKMTDLRIEQLRRDEERKSKIRSDNTGAIYGVLWHILHELQADRVYIVQPHPLSNNHFVSVSMEVKRNGIKGMKSSIQNLEIANVALFVSELASRDYIQFRDIASEVRDKRARAILSMMGAISSVIRRLSDDRYDWIGSIICEFNDTMTADPIFCRKTLEDAADKIQYILPEMR
ncbi:MAG: hypothetical protein OSJ55_07725 [Bacteroidales bacterium]|nr:hypothetical protein [Bacteroidales bacterium]